MSSVAATSPHDNMPDNGQYLTHPDQLTAKIAEWKKQGFHVLTSAIQVSSFAPGYGVSPSLVLLSDDPNDGDVYYDKNTMGVTERALGKIALGKLAAAAGVSWVSGQSGRRDPLTIQNFWIYQMLGVYLAYDGTPQTIHGEKEIDYRDGSAQIGGWSMEAWRELLAASKGKTTEPKINGWTESRVRTARMNGAERAETGAMERAIRMGFGIRHAYTVAELAKPFVTLRVCPLVDMNDPDIRRQVNTNKLAGVAALYSGRVVHHAPVIDIATRRPAGEPVPVGASSTTVPAPAAPVPPASPAPEPPVLPAEPPASVPVEAPAASTPAVSDPAPVAPLCLIADVRRETKRYSQSHAKKGQAFTKWHVTDANGEVHVTIRAAIGEEAERLWRDKVPARVVAERNSFNESEIKGFASPDAAPSSAATQEGGWKL